MDDLKVRHDIVIPGWETWTTTSRSGGPGGQHANKTSSRVTLHWNLQDTTALSEGLRRRVQRKLSGYISDEGILQLSCDETRSQHRNRKLVQERLVEMVGEAVKRTKPRKPTRAPRWVERKRIETKKRRGRLKELRKDPAIPKDY